MKEECRLIMLMRGSLLWTEFDDDEATKRLLLLSDFTPPDDDDDVF